MKIVRLTYACTGAELSSIINANHEYEVESVTGRYYAKHETPQQLELTLELRQYRKDNEAETGILGESSTATSVSEKQVELNFDYEQEEHRIAECLKTAADWIDENPESWNKAVSHPCHAANKLRKFAKELSKDSE